MTSTSIKPASSHSASASLANQLLDEILDYLGVSADQLGPCAEQEGYRIEFEGHYALEIALLHNQYCRLSARICLLAKSQEVQDRQFKKALDLYGELHNEFPICMSIAVSNYDNCLRLTAELNTKTPLIENKPGKIKDYFEHFVNYSHAFKKTYLSTATQTRAA